jgi:hypothetical protein
VYNYYYLVTLVGFKVAGVELYIRQDLILEPSAVMHAHNIIEK